MARMTNADRAFSESERREILDRYFEAYDRLRTASFQGRRDEQAMKTVSDQWDAYLEKTPVLEIAKNPFTGAVFSHSFDPFGLDGPWWDCRNPLRHMEPLPDGVLAFTGAVRLREQIEDVQFLCKPGPGRPFVVPRVLDQEGVKAVLTRLTVGPHVGYGTVYFYEGGWTTAERFNTWGISYAVFKTGEDDFGWFEFETRPEDFDFKLEPWLEQEKLLWIHPDDDGLDHRTGVAGCPFIGLDGEPLLQVTQAGEVWTEEPYAFDDPGEIVMRAEDAQSDQTPPEEEIDEPETRKRFCRSCGHEVGASSAFCGNCGTPVER